jgi:hypothetical protein
MNLRKQVEPLLSVALQASSNRGMHNAQPRGSLRINVGSDEPPKTITSKAGAQGILSCDPEPVNSG